MVRRYKAHFMPRTGGFTTQLGSYATWPDTEGIQLDNKLSDQGKISNLKSFKTKINGRVMN